MSGPGEQFNTAKLDIPKELKGPINICLVTEKPFQGVTKVCTVKPLLSGH